MQLVASVLSLHQAVSQDADAVPNEINEEVREELALLKRASEDALALQRQAFGSRDALALDRPTLLPQNVATLVSAATLAARISIRASALFLEALLEGARYSSMTGLGISRRALVGAVSSARALHYLQDRMGLSSDDEREHAFLDVLDRYSTLGIYVMHSTFSLAELFCMTGFSLTADVLSSTMTAADESVKILDGLFGSTESSRALASIISMVRKELLDDPLFPIAQKGLIGGIAAVTKALTAFACLQIATHRMTQISQRMRVIYDCTVVLSDEMQSAEYEARQPMEAAAFPTLTDADTSTPVQTPRRKSFSSVDRTHRRLLSDDVDIGSVRARVDSRRSSIISRLPSDRKSRNSLFSLAGPSEDEHDSHAAEDVDRELCDLLGTQTREDETELPDDLTDAIDRMVKGEKHGSANVELLERQQSANGGSIELVRSKTSGKIFEIETSITTTEVKTIVRISGDGPAAQRVVAKRTSPGMTRARSARELAARHSHGEEHNGDTSTVEDVFEQEESEWVEVSEMMRQDSAETSEIIPQSLNGSPSIGALSRIGSLQDPEQGRQRLHVVLRSMTKRLVQRKRVMRQVGAEDEPLSRDGSSADLKELEWQASPPPSPSPGAKKHGPVKRMIEVAKKRSTARLRPVKALTTSLPGPGTSAPTSGNPRSSEAPARSPAPKLQRHSSRTSLHSVYTAKTRIETSAGSHSEPLESSFPRGPLAANLRRFVRYSSAAYGQAFMRILGIGTARFNYASTADAHKNHHAFVHHTGLPLENVLLSSFTEPASLLSAPATQSVHYVAVDHSAEAIVLTCRGTLGLSDLLTDLTAHYDAVSLPHETDNRAFYAHSGMLNSARALLQESSTVHECLKKALEDQPSYGLVLCGHSLGGGVAALLSILLSCPTAVFEQQKAHSPTVALHPPLGTPFVTSFECGLPAGRPIACYVYGPPCIVSSELAAYSVGLVTSVVNNMDVIPSLSLGMFKDLKSVAATLWEEPAQAEELIGRVVGLYQARRKASRVQQTSADDDLPQIALTPSEVTAGRTMNRANEPEYQDPAMICGPDDSDLSLDSNKADADQRGETDLWAMMKTLRAGSDAEKLFPAGTVYNISLSTVYVVEKDGVEDFGRAPKVSRHTRQEGRRVILRHVEDVASRFGEPTFAKSMFSDHAPNNYEEAIEMLARAVLPS